jgi:hypothetical protein
LFDGGLLLAEATKVRRAAALPDPLNAASAGLAGLSGPPVDHSMEIVPMVPVPARAPVDANERWVFVTVADPKISGHAEMNSNGAVSRQMQEYVFGAALRRKKGTALAGSAELFECLRLHGRGPMYRDGPDARAFDAVFKQAMDNGLQFRQFRHSRPGILLPPETL